MNRRSIIGMVRWDAFGNLRMTNLAINCVLFRSAVRCYRRSLNYRDRY